MAKRRSAQGKMIDMSSLIAKNENVRAVGNMKVNARGDRIDAAGRVVKSANDKVADSYGRTVGNKSSHVVKPKIPNKNELTKEEIDLEKQLAEDFEVEQLKKKGS